MSIWPTQRRATTRDEKSANARRPRPARVPAVMADATPFLGAVEDTEVLAGLGFRFGSRGTHSSRTFMLAELRLMLRAVPASADRAAYERSAIGANVLGKATSSVRA